MSLFRFPAFSYGILTSVQNDGGRQGVIMSECEGSAAVVRESVGVTQSANKGFATVLRKGILTGRIGIG